MRPSSPSGAPRGISRAATASAPSRPTSARSSSWALSGPSLAIQVTRAIKLLDLYGDEVFAAAVAEIVARGLRDTSALAVACDRLRVERRRPVPVDLHLPAHADDRDVVPHDLETYDAD